MRLHLSPSSRLVLLLTGVVFIVAGWRGVGAITTWNGLRKGELS